MGVLRVVPSKDRGKAGPELESTNENTVAYDNDTGSTNDEGRGEGYVRA